jgi:hypothetical protein
MKKVLLVLAVAGMAASAHAAVDGVKDAAYGTTALAVQTVDTQFGDNFSELNAAWCYSDGTNLNLLVTGNLEGNFNKLHILLDYTSGGVNTFGGVPYAGGMNGMTFDAGFNADLDIQINGDGSTWFVNAWDFNTVQAGDYLGSNNGSGAALSGGGNWLGLGLGLNNSNTAGVGGGTGAANTAAALAVTTGIEISIPLSFFGGSLPAGTRGMAFVNGGGNDFLSNQFLGGLAAGTANLGGPGSVNLANQAGDQFFVIPTPGAAALLGLGGLVAARRRRA